MCVSDLGLNLGDAYNDYILSNNTNALRLLSFHSESTMFARIGRIATILAEVISYSVYGLYGYKIYDLLKNEFWFVWFVEVICDQQTKGTVYKTHLKICQII